MKAVLALHAAHQGALERPSTAMLQHRRHHCVGVCSSMKLVPTEAGYVNDLLTKKSLRDHHCRRVSSPWALPRTAQFLDDIKTARLLRWPTKVALQLQPQRRHHPDGEGGAWSMRQMTVWVR